MEIIEILSKEMKWDRKGIVAAVKLFDEGKTLPFISRYRKDHTNGLDDEQLFYLKTRLSQLRNLFIAKEKAINKLKELGVLNEKLSDAINASKTVSDVDEIIKPYKSKRKTRAMKARELGFQSLADVIMGRMKKPLDQVLVKDAGSKDEQIKIALDIIAEESITHPEIKQIAINNLESNSLSVIIDTSNENASKYENLNKIQSNPKQLKPHQIHALMRAEKEKVVKIKFSSNIDKITNQIVLSKQDRPPKQYATLYLEGVADGVKRLLLPRAETSLRQKLKEKADLRAIEVFKKNLFNLLMEPPIKPQTILGIDPGYVSGCKIAVINNTGDLLDTATIYPTPPREDINKSSSILFQFCDTYDIDFIVIGNGTGSQETKIFVKNFLEDRKLNHIQYQIIPETGASVYSASAVAREEFPDLAVEMRGAISIARRVLDPLAELVKIEPQALGIGQYQHDINQKLLSEALEFVVTSAINKHGINLETASKEALNYIAGITPSLAKNIIIYREEIGFNSIKDLLKVKRLGKSVYEQCSGFLRLMESKNILDGTMIHPDYYDIAQNMVYSLGMDLEDWQQLSETKRKKDINKINVKEFQTEDVGQQTITDIINELITLGRDVRGYRKFMDHQDQPTSIEDLKPKMLISGRVNNVADFGAFIDIGVKYNGLIHKSKLADRFITDVHSILKIGDNVKVRILDVELERKRISLQLLEVNGNKP